jgi:hypothetical protein
VGPAAELTLYTPSDDVTVAPVTLQKSPLAQTVFAAAIALVLATLAVSAVSDTVFSYGSDTTNPYT